MIEKDPRLVLGDAHALEAYLADYFSREGITFSEWVARFGEGAYHARNALVLDGVRAVQPRRVLEFACAGPHLARLLLEQEPGIEEYLLSNYSAEMVQHCAVALKHESRCRVELLDANVRRSPDLRRANLDRYDLILTTSFEHVEYDRELIAELRPGSAFVFSVALFDDLEHYRVFESPADCTTRYGDLLEIRSLRSTADGGKLVASAVRRNVPA